MQHKNIKASKEHLELSTYIKNVHKRLRLDSTTNGWEETWKKHISDTHMLKQYASSMENLACTHWQDNQRKENSKALSRITWVHNKCQLYFASGMLKAREQEDAIAEKCSWPTNEHLKQSPHTKEHKLTLLDVGSCYNPFQQFHEYEVVAIDIAPSNDNVLQCDFLNVDIALAINQDLQHVPMGKLQFHQEMFDVIVFSLLLDYFPKPELRLQCCKNAYKLLKFEGLLIIISPDAKHVGANAKYMKSWRHILAGIGLRRIVYEKLPYLHCMVFRKSTNEDVAKRWATLHSEGGNFFDKMYVPQDFNNTGTENK